MAILNPALFLKRLALELKAMIVRPPDHPIVKILNGVKFEFDTREDPYVRLMYFGLYEMGIVQHVMKNFLQKGDVFIDVGASIGYHTAFGAGYVGKTGEVHAFEPVPQYFEKLQKVARMNSECHIFVNQCALGDAEGDVDMYLAKTHIVNNSIVRDFIGKGEITTTIRVPIRRLDSYIKEKELTTIKLIKIDVEGYEFSVLKGMERFFEETPNLPFIICEICPPAAHLQGYEVRDILLYMEKFSYAPYEVFNTNKKMNPSEIEKEHTIDVVFKPTSKL